MNGSEDRALRMLGLATRAGKTKSGAQACQIAIRNGTAKAVLTARDMAPAGQEKIHRLCAALSVPVQTAGTAELLGRYTGKSDRTVVAIMDSAMAERIIQLLTDTTGTRNEEQG